MSPCGTTARPTTRQQPRSPKAFVCVVLGLAASSLLIIAWYSGDSSPDLVALAVLTVLMILATHRETFFGDETALSGSFIVALASVVFFVESGTPLGIAVCAACGGMHLAHFRSRAWSRLIVNSSVHLIAAALAATSFELLAHGMSPHWVGIAIAIPQAVAVYWVANNLVLALVIGTFDGGPVLSRAFELIRSETEMLGFAVAGAGCGYVMVEVSRAAGLAGLVAVLVAVDLVVIRRERLPRVGMRIRNPGLVLQVASGVFVASAVAAAIVVEPVPALGPLLALMGASAIGALLGSRLTADRSLSLSVITSLAAVGVFAASSPLLGTVLVGSAGGLVMALTSRGGFERRCFLLAMAALPALAAGGVATALSIDSKSGFAAVVTLSCLAAVTAVVARASLSAAAVAARARAGWFLLALGEAVGDVWLVLAGIATAAAGFYSLAAGLASVLVALVVLATLERRDGAITPVTDAHEHDELVAAIAAALRDRPDAPPVPSS